MRHYVVLNFLILSVTLISRVLTISNNCCELLLSNDVKSLKSCVISTTLKHNSNILPIHAPYLVRKHGPKLLISFITRASPEIDEYASYSLLSNVLYMKLHDYGYIIEENIDNNSKFKDDYEYYRKLAPIIESLIDTNTSYPTVANQCDYLIWIDADVVILDINFKIENIIDKFPKANIIMSADVSAIANTGFIIIKNNKWSLNFLHNWYNQRLKNKYVSDQNGFEIVYNRFYNTSRDKIVILPPDAINSDAPPMSRQRDHNQILHLASEHNYLRQSIFYKAATEMCKYEKKATKQLGIDRNYILSTTRSVYHDILMQKLLSIVENLDLESDGFSAVDTNHNFDERRCKIPSVESFAELRQVVSKYCYATVTVFNGSETAETLKLRKFVFSLTKFLLENINDILNGANTLTATDRAQDMVADILENEFSSPDQRYCYDQDNADIHCQTRLLRQYFMKNLPEYLKFGCELALDYLLAIPLYNTNMIDHNVPTDNINEKINIGKYILDNINKLLEIVDKSQQHLVVDMKASITSQLGELLLLLHSYDQGMDYLKSSLQLYDQLGLSLESDSNSISGGDLRNFFATAALYAKALCGLGNYESGINLLEKVVLLESNHVGSMHVNIAVKYQRLGQCWSLSNNEELAQSYFTKCNHIIETGNYEGVKCN